MIVRRLSRKGSPPARRSEMRWIYFHRHDIICSEIIKKNTGYMEPVIQEAETKSVLTKSNLPVADFSVNLYVGCAHACKYCYASFMKRCKARFVCFFCSTAFIFRTILSNPPHWYTDLTYSLHTLHRPKVSYQYQYLL